VLTATIAAGGPEWCNDTRHNWLVLGIAMAYEVAEISEKSEKCPPICHCQTRLQASHIAVRGSDGASA
jgi:hypothetical protein